MKLIVKQKVDTPLGTGRIAEIWVGPERRKECEATPDVRVRVRLDRGELHFVLGEDCRPPRAARPTVTPGLHKGDVVTVTAGPHAGLRGTVLTIYHRDVHLMTDGGRELLVWDYDLEPVAAAVADAAHAYGHTTAAARHAGRGGEGR